MIRKATPEDFGQITELSREFWKYTQFKEPFEAEHTVLMVNQAYEHGLLAVLIVKGDMVGFVAGVKSFLLGSTQALCGTELAWWVNKEQRDGSNGVSLLRYIEDLAREQGVKYWTMVSMQSCSPDRANEIYRKMGYSHTETNFTKVL